MDYELYRIACEIIDMDCTLQGQLRDGKGNFCAVGGLYTLLDPDWAAAEDSSNVYAEYTSVEELFRIVVGKVWEANDQHSGLVERREAVKEALLRAMEENDGGKWR